MVSIGEPEPPWISNTGGNLSGAVHTVQSRRAGSLGLEELEQSMHIRLHCAGGFRQISKRLGA